MYSLANCKLKQDPTTRFGPEHWQFQMLARTQSSGNCHPLSLGVKSGHMTQSLCFLMLAQRSWNTTFTQNLRTDAYGCFIHESQPPKPLRFVRWVYMCLMSFWRKEKCGDYERTCGCWGLGWTQCRGPMRGCLILCDSIMADPSPYSKPRERPAP